MPSSINFSHQKLVEMFVQLQKGTITVNRAIEDMRDIVYSDTSTLVSGHHYKAFAARGKSWQNHGSHART